MELVFNRIGVRDYYTCMLGAQGKEAYKYTWYFCLTSNRLQEALCQCFPQQLHEGSDTSDIPLKQIPFQLE